MLFVIRLFLILYGAIAAITGFMGMTAAFDQAASPEIDNNHRFVAAIWASMSLAFFYVASNPLETALFRFLMIAVFIGAVTRAVALVNYKPTPFMIFSILLELLPTVLLYWMQSKLKNSGSH